MRKLWDYLCPECQRKIERLVRDDEKVRCECGAEMERRWPRPAVKVKGGYSEKLYK